MDNRLHKHFVLVYLLNSTEGAYCLRCYVIVARRMAEPVGAMHQTPERVLKQTILLDLRAYCHRQQPPQEYYAASWRLWNGLRAIPWHLVGPFHSLPLVAAAKHPAGRLEQLTVASRNNPTMQRCSKAAEATRATPSDAK